MIKIECFGDICPIPLIKLKKQLKLISDGETIILVSDHSCVVESISDYYNKSKHKLEIIEVIDGVWEIYLTKNKGF